jgi:uncharacterized RDD family membrane protein YckC
VSTETGTPAAWWKRAVAIVVDGIIVFVIGTIVGVVLGLGFFTRVVFIELLGFAYYGLLNGSTRGQTVGKMVLRIRTRSEIGGPLGIGPAVLRYAMVFVLTLLCGIPALVDAAWPLWDKRRQALHDKVVRSVVVNA